MGVHPWLWVLCARSALAHLPRVFQGKQEENDVVEKLNLFLDLLQSYKVSLGCCLVRDRAVEKAAVTFQGCDSGGHGKRA